MAVSRDTPDGCRHCGIPRRVHATQWLPGVGDHLWIAPTDEQRLQRMQARRTQREEPK